MKHIVVTGASKGLGEALSYEAVNRGYKVHCISRSINEGLAELDQVEYYPFDLTNLEEIPGLVKDIYKHLKNCEELYVIHNAGMVGPIKPVEQCDPNELFINHTLNLTAPMIFTSELIKRSLSLKAKKRIMNISSGAARSPIASWSAYCSSKAGLDMFTRTVALEQDECKYPWELVAMAPGIVDTGMQAEIRSARPEEFSRLEDFINYKETNKLSKPDDVAKKLIDYILSDKFENGGLLRVTDV